MAQIRSALEPVTESHRHLWDTPVDDRGNPIGPVYCEVCNKQPEVIRCVNCGETIDETVIRHGTLRKGLHSTVRPSNPRTQPANVCKHD